MNNQHGYSKVFLAMMEIKPDFDPDNIRLFQGRWVAIVQADSKRSARLRLINDEAALWSGLDLSNIVEIASEQKTNQPLVIFFTPTKITT